MTDRRHASSEHSDVPSYDLYRAPMPSPGKRTLTAGLISRKAARDDNGVAAGADAAVDRAASTSGSPLPDHLRGQFESSLGADLSGVRVHTGAESAEASHAVGAKAYTTGQDIHFGAGYYDPSSAFGVHLLAHEVAHTVQQQGASPSMQHKLEVSTPQDGAELEADRAADAMVVGAAAHVSAMPTTGPARATLFRQDCEVLDESGQPMTPADETVFDDNCNPQSPGPAENRQPDELDWGAMATPTSEMISGAWFGAPVYAGSSAATNQTPNVANGQFMGAFNASYSQAVDSWNALVPYTAAYQSQERALGGIDPEGTMKTEVQGKRISDSFLPNNELSAHFDQTNDKVSAADRLEIKPLKDAVSGADTKVTNGGSTLKQHAISIQQQRNLAASAVNAGKTAALAEDKNKDTLKQGQLQREFAQVMVDIDFAMAASGGLLNTVAALLDPSKIPAEVVKGVVNTADKYAKMGAVENFNKQANTIATRISAADSKINALAADSANNSYKNCLEEMKKISIEMEKVATQLQTDIAARDTAYAVYGNKIKEVAQRTKSLDEKDAAKVGTAIESVPQIERIIGTCSSIIGAASVPAYNADSGKGASLATTASVQSLAAHVGGIKGTKALVEKHKAQWEARLASVKAAYL